MILHLLMLLGPALEQGQATAEPQIWNLDQVTYLSRPQPEFPDGARYSRGEASVICVVTARGTFRSCLVETETPSGNGFGRAAVASMQRGARIEMGSDGPVEGDRMRATLRFWNGQ